MVSTTHNKDPNEEPLQPLEYTMVDRGGVARGMEPLFRGRNVHREVKAKLVEQVSRYAESATRRALKVSQD